ncbi:MAG: tRNA pseudouridine(38-40) synthase TruA [Acidobacteriota bacterium]
MSCRMKLVVAYLGTSFHGWQRQARQMTVQGELERMLAKLADGFPVTVVGAGRTDAGVHAAAQTAHVDLPTSIPPEGLVRALNHLLPREIRVRSARRVDSRFHARKSALGKRYTYRARWQETSLPWHGLRTAVVAPPQNPENLNMAAGLLCGRHDWASFTVPNPEVSSTERVLSRVCLRERGDGLDLAFVGGGFLRYQVRRMVGALFEVGWDRRSLAEFQNLIRQPTPGAPLWTAPAEGLTLERVYYRSSPLLSSD